MREGRKGKIKGERQRAKRDAERNGKRPTEKRNGARESQSGGETVIIRDRQRAEETDRDISQRDT